MPGFQKNDVQSEPLVFSLELGIAQRVEEPWSRFAHPVKIQYANRHADSRENLESSDQNIDSDFKIQYTSHNNSVENLNTHLDLYPQSGEIILTNELESFTSITESYSSISFNQTEPFEILNEGLKSPKGLDCSCHGDINLEADIIDEEVENIFKENKNLKENLESIADCDKMEDKESGILYTFEEITSENTSDKDLKDEQLNSDFKPRQKLLLRGNLLDDIESHDTGVAWGNETLSENRENNQALLQHQHDACETDSLQKCVDDLLFKKPSDRIDDTLSDNEGCDGQLLLKEPFNSKDGSKTNIDGDGNNHLSVLKDSSNVGSANQDNIVDLNNSDLTYQNVFKNTTMAELSDGLNDKQTHSISKTAELAELSEELDENQSSVSFDDNFMNLILDKIVSKVTGGTGNLESSEMEENVPTASEDSKPEENVSEIFKQTNSEGLNLMQTSNEPNISVSENFASSVNVPNLFQNDKHGPDKTETFPESYEEKSESSPENVSEKNPERSLELLEPESCTTKPEPIPENILEKKEAIEKDLELNKSSQRIDDKSKPMDTKSEENITNQRNKEDSKPIDKNIPESKTSPKKSGKGKQKGGTAKLTSYLKGLAKKHKPGAQKTTETMETINTPSSSLPSANNKNVKDSQKVTTQTSGIISSRSDNKSNLANENKLENYSETDSKSERPVEERNDIFSRPSASIIQSSVHDNDLSPLITQERNFSNPFVSDVETDTENFKNGSPVFESMSYDTISSTIVSSSEQINQHSNSSSSPDLFQPIVSENENRSSIHIQTAESSATITKLSEQMDDDVSTTNLRSESKSKNESTSTTVRSPVTNVEDSVIDDISNDIQVRVTSASISSGINKPKTSDTDSLLINRNDNKDIFSASSDAKPPSSSSSSSSLDTANNGIQIDTSNSKPSMAIDAKLSSSSSSFSDTTNKGHTSPIQVKTNDSSTQFLSAIGSSVNTGEVKQEEIIETQPCVEAERKNIDLKLDADDDCQTWNEEQKTDPASTSLRNNSQKKNDGTEELDSFFKSLKPSPQKPKENSKTMNAKPSAEEDDDEKRDDIALVVTSDERCSVAGTLNQPIPPNSDKTENLELVSESDIICVLDTVENNLNEMSQVKHENVSSELTGKPDMLDLNVSLEFQNNVSESLGSKAVDLESSKIIPELGQSENSSADEVCNVISDNENSHFNPLLDILEEDDNLIESCNKEQEVLEFDNVFEIPKSVSMKEPSGISGLQTFETPESCICETEIAESEFSSSESHLKKNDTRTTCDKNDINALTPNKELFSNNDVFDATTPINVVSGHSYLFETSPIDSDLQSLSSPQYDTEQSPGSIICDSGFLSQHSMSDDGRLDDIAIPDPVTKLTKDNSESDLIGSEYNMVSEDTDRDSEETVAMKTENSFDEELFEVNPSIIDECLDIQGNYYETTPIREQSIIEEEESCVSVSPVNDMRETWKEGEIKFGTALNEDMSDRFLELNLDSEIESDQNNSVVMVSYDGKVEENKNEKCTNILIDSDDGKIQHDLDSFGIDENDIRKSSQDDISKAILQESEEKQKEVNRKPLEEEIIKDKLSEYEEDILKDQLSDSEKDGVTEDSIKNTLSESNGNVLKDKLSKSEEQPKDDIIIDNPESLEVKSDDKGSEEILSGSEERLTRDEDDEALNFEEVEKLNMELMEKLHANQAHLISIHHGDDDVSKDVDNASGGDSSECQELVDEQPSSLPYYARSSASEKSNLPDNFSKPSILPYYAKTKAESAEEKIPINSEISMQCQSTGTFEENVDTTQKDKVPKYKQADETYSFSEFNEDLKLEPVSNIRKMFEKENSPVPSPQSSPMKTKARSRSKSPQKTDCDISSPNVLTFKEESKSPTQYDIRDTGNNGSQRNNDKESETPEINDVRNIDNKLSTRTFNDNINEGNKTKLDDKTIKSDEEIISWATPLEDVTQPSVSVRNMLKMWEDNRRRESHDYGSPIKPFNKLSKKWHSCCHIYFKSDNFDDSTTSVTTDDGPGDLTKYGVGDSDHTRQRHKVVYKSCSYISLSPTANQNEDVESDDWLDASPSYQENYDFSDFGLKDTKQDGGHSVATTTKKETVTEVKGKDQRGGVSSMKIKQETATVPAPASSTIHQNGVDTKVTQQTTKQEVRQTETTRTMAAQENNYQDFDEDEDDEGVYENVPAAPRTDVFRETDNKVEIELPQASTAKNMRERFLKLAEESAAGNRTADKELTPPPAIRGQIEAGVFESQPEPSRNDVYHYTEQSKEVITEKGKALNTVQRYKEIASREFKGPANKRDITPDRSGVVEYVSEPRAEHLTYEEKPLEAGIFESQPTVVENVSRYEDYVPDELPQQGTARNIASRFHEIERNATLPPAPSNRREVTPDRHGRGEYVSEPRAQHLTYEEKVEGGIYENQPAPVRTDIFRHEEYYQEEPLPEKGYAKNIVSRFKEIEKNAHIHQKTIQRLSPPKDSKAVVYENEPSASPIAYKETVKEEDILPERGQAKNLASRFKQIEQENLKARAGNRQVKEFTPPKDDRSVFESQPSKSHLTYEERQVEHGILESQPSHREDVCRESDPKNIEEELPERGVAKNLLSRWKQIESSSNRASPPTPGRVKEFTPPREEERIKELRSPKNLVSPTGPGNSVHPNDLPGQYQPINEPTVFESQPTAPREDLFREADTNWASGLPKPNKTKKVLAKFQAIQSKAQSSPVSPANRKEEAAPPTPVKENKTKKGGIFMPVQNEKCGACQKTVYAMEKVEMNKNAYHRACFKCSQCSTVLTPKTFAINAGTMFCTSHYKQLFARKGNYDEGFGRQQHKKKWKSESNLLDKELVDMEHEIEA